MDNPLVILYVPSASAVFTEANPRMTTHRHFTDVQLATWRRDGLVLLGGRLGAAGAAEGAPDPAGKSRLGRHAQLRERIGAEGVTITALRPVGIVKINGQRIDAMAESGIVEANTPVVVADVYDNQIKVRPRPQASL